MMDQDSQSGPHRHFNYSNVMSTLAVFLVIAGGSALAAALPKNSVTSKTVKDNSLKSKDLRDGKAVKAVDVNAEQVQLRVGESCPAGQAIRVINVQGGVICEVDDQGAGGGGPPSGPAGGDLTGAYPNPTIANGAVNSAKIADQSIFSGDVAPDALGGGQIANGSLTGSDIGNDTLTGDDVNESLLGQVPLATLGGLGRSGNDADDSCDPESATLTVCTSVDVTLPVQTHVLVIGQIEARDEIDADSYQGTCELGTTVLDLPSTSSIATGGAAGSPRQSDNLTLVGVTPLLGPGMIQFRIRCNQLSGAIEYGRSEIAAVALSPS